MHIVMILNMPASPVIQSGALLPKDIPGKHRRSRLLGVPSTCATRSRRSSTVGSPT